MDEEPERVNGWRQRTQSALETQALATELGRVLDVGDTVTLNGALGAGKTTFTQGLARGLGIADLSRVTSPTFSLVNHHEGPKPLTHADFYRIRHENELDELGLDEAFDTSVAVIEWSELHPAVIPKDRLEVTLKTHSCETHRWIEFSATGPRSRAVLASVASNSSRTR